MSERKIVDYKILYEEFFEPLEVAVYAYIEQGWQPHGPVVSWPEADGRAPALVQPMVRYAEPEPALNDELERLAFKLADRITKPPRDTIAYWTEIYECRDKILAIKAKREGGQDIMTAARNATKESEA